MAVLHRHRHPGLWTPQRVPTEPTEVDQSHPLANGLTSAYVLGQLKDAVGASGPASIAGGASLGSSPLGLAGVFTATAGPLISVPDAPALNLVSAGTVCAWVTFDVLSSRVIFIGKGLGNGSVDTSFWLEKNAANNPVSYFSSAATDHVLTGTSSTISDNKTHFICATYDGAKQSVYLDGVADPATASWAAAITSNTNPLRFGNGLTSSFNLNLGGSISLFLLYNRSLSAAEIAQLNAEPFGMLRPVARRTYGFVAATGGALSGTAAIVSSASGVLTGKGALSGTSAIVSAATGTLTGKGALSGTAPITSATFATLTATGSLTGTAAIVSTATGTLTTSAAGAMTGTAALTVATIATLAGKGSLASISAIVSSASGVLTAFGVFPVVIAKQVSTATRIKSTSTTTRTIKVPAVTQATPIRLDAMREGSTDTRGIDLTPALATESDTPASITSISVVRRDGVTIGAGDLAITPSGKVTPWITGQTANWWQTAGAALAAAGAVEYKLTITLVTASGRTLPYDAYQLITPTLG